MQCNSFVPATDFLILNNWIITDLIAVIIYIFGNINLHGNWNGDRCGNERITVNPKHLLFQRHFHKRTNKVLQIHFSKIKIKITY